jgi:hypothetical protein
MFYQTRLTRLELDWRPVRLQRRLTVVRDRGVLRIPRVRRQEPPEPHDRELGPCLKVVRRQRRASSSASADPQCSQITDAVAKSGKLAGKNFTIEGKCDNGMCFCVGDMDCA